MLNQMESGPEFLRTERAGEGSKVMQLMRVLGQDGGNRSSSVGEDFFCKWVLFKEVGDSQVRIWDLAILVPNLVFFLFLALRFNRARLKFRASSSPIFFTFYGLVAINVIISLVRCVVSMTVNAAVEVGDIADKVLWVIVRCFLLSTEMSVVIFCLAFGHLDSKSSIRHVLLATSAISLAFSVSQGALEIVSPDESFLVPSKQIYLFSHGGMLFWFVSSLIFTTIYTSILILPWTRLRERLALPSRRSFYYYIGFLSTLNLSQSVGSGLLLYHTIAGLCIVDITSYVYFTLLTPLVYHTFLSEFFGVTQPSIMFSYKAQVDDTMEDDTVSLPHQQSFSSLKTDSDYIYQSSGVYDSTHFDATGNAGILGGVGSGATPANPIYAASLQSPDSITGYSISSLQGGPINSDSPTN